MTSQIEAARRAIADTGRRMCADGLVQGTAGNISVRDGDLVAISPSGIPYEQVDAADVCVVDMSGANHRLLATRGPSSELPMHLAIYASTDAAAVVHHHGVHSTAVSTVLDELPPIHYYALRLGGPTRVAPYATYGTPELARSVLDALVGRTAALLQNHGAVAYGDTLESAYDRAHLLEWLCTLHMYANALGDPRVLTDVELAAVLQRHDRKASA